MNILGKRSDLPFSRKSDRKKEKSTVSFTYVQNIICSQTQLDGIAHEQTIICRQLFAGHVVNSPPMKRMKKNEKFSSNDNSQSSDDVRPDPTHIRRNPSCSQTVNFVVEYLHSN